MQGICDRPNTDRICKCTRSLLTKERKGIYSSDQEGPTREGQPRRANQEGPTREGQPGRADQEGPTREGQPGRADQEGPTREGRSGRTDQGSREGRPRPGRMSQWRHNRTARSAPKDQCMVISHGRPELFTGRMDPRTTLSRTIQQTSSSRQENINKDSFHFIKFT